MEVLNMCKTPFAGKQIKNLQEEIKNLQEEIKTEVGIKRKTKSNAFGP